jgi:hypothetical protein
MRHFHLETVRLKNGADRLEDCVPLMTKPLHAVCGHRERQRWEFKYWFDLASGQNYTHEEVMQTLNSDRHLGFDVPYWCCVVRDHQTHNVGCEESPCWTELLKDLED